MKDFLLTITENGEAKTHLVRSINKESVIGWAYRVCLIDPFVPHNISVKELSETLDSYPTDN